MLHSIINKRRGVPWMCLVNLLKVSKTQYSRLHSVCPCQTLWQKSIYSKKGLFDFHFQVTAHPCEKSWQELKAETWEKKKGECCLLTHSVSGLCTDEFLWSQGQTMEVALSTVFHVCSQQFRNAPISPKYSYRLVWYGQFLNWACHLRYILTLSLSSWHCQDES